MKSTRFRDIYYRIRPHKALGDRTPCEAYTAGRWSVRFNAPSLRRTTGRVLRDAPAAVRPAITAATAAVSLDVPSHTQHPLGAVVNRPSVSADR